MEDMDFMMEDSGEDDSLESQYPQQRNAANARERARMRVLSKAFCRLKTTLPWVPPDTKLSKLDTLRLATSYIAHLRTILKLSDNDAPDPSTQPVNMSWPFNFHSNWDTQLAKDVLFEGSVKNNWGSCTTEYCQYSNKRKYGPRKTKITSELHQLVPSNENEIGYAPSNHCKPYYCFHQY